MIHIQFLYQVFQIYNEEESLGELVPWIDRVMVENNFSYEIVMVDDGSNDQSWKVIESLRQQNNHVKAIKFRRNYGKYRKTHRKR